MSGSVVEVLKTTPRMGRRSLALIDIDNKYVSQSGIWEASEVETSKGSIRIQHLTAVAQSLRSVSSGSGATSIVGGPPTNPRFPKLEECAHFHYDYVELPLLKILIREDTAKSITLPVDEPTDKCAFAIEVSAGVQSWVIRRTHANFMLLDEQLHRCVWDRSFSRLEDLKESLSNTGKCKGSFGNLTTTAAANAAVSSRRRHHNSNVSAEIVNAAASEDLVVVGDQDELQHTDRPDEEHEHSACRDIILRYLSRLGQLPTNKITCGTVLSWLELDNRGRHIVSSDDSDINTPAVAAACAVRKYIAAAADEISFEVGDMISVIDMPPPQESIWWRGKRGFHVGFFHRDCVQVIGDKVPVGLPIVSSVRRLQRLSVSSAPASSSPSSSAPEKPVLRKHGKLIAFFRSFILSRPSRRRLKQSGILRERVFSCDLAEHLLNTGNDIPAVLKCCAEFIEKRGIVDGIYRLSGITSNIQKLRNLFDEDKTPNLEDDMAIKQDIHAVSSLLKMYFRELPNPLCTYQLYEKFVGAAQASDEERLFRMREVVHELPPPHYRTLEYLMKHLARVASRSSETGMTPKNMAIVWAPNLIRCKELEAGGVDALKGIGVQAVVTEYLVRHADLIFNDKLPANYPITTTVLSHKASCSSSGRPKSLAISSPIRLMSLEEAQGRQKQDDRKYIDVGGGPASLPPKYHTVIDLPSRRSALKNKRSPIGWRQFFSRNRSFSKPSSRKTTNPIEITVVTKSMPMAGPQGMQSNWAGRLRPVKSVESLVSSPGPLFNSGGGQSVEHNSHGPTSSISISLGGNHNHHLEHESILEDVESSLSKSSPATPIMTDVDVLFHVQPESEDILNPLGRNLQNPKTHNRSISHDSYFEFGEFRDSNRVYIDETLEEETLSQSSKLSLDVSSGGESPTRKSGYGKDPSKRKSRGTTGGMMSPVTPPPSAASLVVPTSNAQGQGTVMSESVTSTSSDDVLSSEYTNPKSPLLPSKWRDSEVQTSHTKLYDVGVCTHEDMGDMEESCAKTCTTTSTTMTSLSSVSRRSGTTTGSGSGVIRDGSEQSLLSHSSSGYELDRNSSVDGSSVDSTPGEPFATTNIIYSPLVDDLSSPGSSENHFKFGMGGIDPFRVSSDSEASVKSSTSKNSKNSKKGSTFYVSPLYESGVHSTMESLSSAQSAGTEMTDVSVSVVTSPSNSNPNGSNGNISNRSNINTRNQYENVSVINTHTRSNSKPNLQVFLCSSASSQSLDVGSTSSSRSALEGSKVGHVYENQRLYENQPPPVPAIRKSKSEGAVMNSLKNGGNSDVPPQLQAFQVSSTTILVNSPKVQEEEQKPSQPLYEKGQYENVSGIEIRALPRTHSNSNDSKKREEDEEEEMMSTTAASNIYEDIDEDDDLSEDDLNSGNKYEEVEFEKGVMSKRPLPLEKITDNSSDNEYEKVEESPVKIHHHYAEIEERMDTTSVSPDLRRQDMGGSETTTLVISSSSNTTTTSIPKDKEEGKCLEESVSVVTAVAPGASHLSVVQGRSDKSEESSPSHSHTEDMVTYLEVRNNSLDDQEEISQPSSDSCGGNKLSKMNSLNSDTPSGSSPPVADEGEIRHIDSPLNSPGVVTPGVDNPLYGMPPEIDVGQELRNTVPEPEDAKEFENDDGEDDMSVNESISISISLEETTSSSKVKHEPLVSSTQNTSQDSQENGAVVLPSVMKLVSRCNSAPLSVSVHEFTIALDRGEADKMSLDDGQIMNGAGVHTELGLDSNGGKVSEKDEIEKRFGEKILLCKRLSEPSLLFSNNSNLSSTNPANCRLSEGSNCTNAMHSLKTDSSQGPCAGDRAAWKIADAKRLANRKQSVKELLSRFESRDGSSTSPVQSPTQTLASGGGITTCSLPPTGLSTSRTEISQSNNNGKSSSNNSLNRSSNDLGRLQRHRFSTGDILMTQSVSVVENLSTSIPGSLALQAGAGTQSTNIIPRSDTFPELSRDDSSSKENTLHGSFSSDKNAEEEAPDKANCALRVVMSSVDMNDPSRRERIEKYKEERRSFLRQKISSELTSNNHNVNQNQPKSPTESIPPNGNGQILLSPKSPDSDPESMTDILPPLQQMSQLQPPCNNSNNRSNESPRKRAFSEDINTGGIPPNSTSKSIKTDPFSLKCAFLASTTTSTSSTKVTETSISSNSISMSSLSSIATSSTTTTETLQTSTVTSLKSPQAESPEEINVRERVAMWSSQKKESSSSSLTSNPSSLTSLTSISSVSSVPLTPPATGGGGVQGVGGNSSISVVGKASILSTSTTELPKVSKPLLRRELTTSAIEVNTRSNTNVSTKQLQLNMNKLGRTSSAEGTGKKIKDMAAFFEAKQF